MSTKITKQQSGVGSHLRKDEKVESKTSVLPSPGHTPGRKNSKDRKAITGRSYGDVQSSPGRTDSSHSSRMRNYFSLEKVLNWGDPWGWALLRPCLLFALSIFVINFTISSISYTFLKGDPFQYSDCDDVYNTTGGDIERIIPHFVAEKAKQTVRHKSGENTQLAMMLLAHSLLIIFFICDSPVMNTVGFISIAGSVLASIGLFLIASTITAWKVIGLVFSHLAAKAIRTTTLITAIENSPSHMREFGVYTSLIAGIIGDSLFLVYQYNVPDGTTTGYAAMALWISFGVAAFFLARPSVPFLLHKRRVKKLENALTEMKRNDEAMSMDVDKVVDDVLYKGKYQEPETPIETLLWTCGHSGCMKHLLFFALLCFIASLGDRLPNYLLQFTNVPTPFLRTSLGNLWSTLASVITLIILLTRGRFASIEIALSMLVCVGIAVPSIPRTNPDYCRGGEAAVGDQFIWFLHLSGIAFQFGMQCLTILGPLSLIEYVPHLGRPLFFAVAELIFTVMKTIGHRFNHYVTKDLRLPEIVVVESVIVLLGALIWSCYIKKDSEVFVTYNDMLIRFGAPPIDITEEEEDEEERSV